MGWWQGLNGVSVIGDGPADRLGLALDEIVAAAPDRPRFEDVLAAFGQALNRNPRAYVSDAERAPLRSVVAVFEPGEALEVPVSAAIPPPDWIDRLQSAIEEAAMDYQSSPLARKPTIDELLETLAFVLRPIAAAIVWPRTSALRSLHAPTEAPTLSRGQPGGEVVTLLPQASLALVHDVLSSMQWRRDPDRTDARTQTPGELSLASWSRGEGDDGEVDYHYDEHAGARWLEVRGEEAAKHAAEIAAMVGGTRKGTAEDMLVDLMTPPRRGASDRLGATGMLRWRSLRAALASAGPANMALIVPMIRAGLRDPDWRVRMTAMLAVGRLRLAALAEETMAAKVPAAGKSGLSSEDHRELLALRQAAHDRAKGLSPSTGPGEGMPEDIAAKRRAYQQRLHALLGGEAADEGDTAALLIIGALMDAGQARPDRYPPRWRRWLDREER
jgi:hypothetical protein